MRVNQTFAHRHLELFSIRRAPDKPEHLAASESAMEVWINDVGPGRGRDAAHSAAS